MKIYLAGPYSHKDPLIREQRFKMLNKYAAHLMRQGHIVYSPISMSHPIAVDNDLPLEFEFWEKQDTAFIEWCDIVHVLMVNGYKESKGVQREVFIAQTAMKQVYFIEVKDYENN